jgi:hypothetical protein
MQYSAPVLKDRRVFENYIDTQQAVGHLVEGGPLPAFLLTQQFEETPGVYDEHALGDYLRRTVADFRPDPPTREEEMPRDTRAYSQAARNLRDTGSRSGQDAPDHSEMFYGFLDQDTRTPGDGSVPLRAMAEHARARARYLKPTEPIGGASHLTEAITEGIETEGRRYEKLQEARKRARGWRLFSRTIENPSTRGARDWHQSRSVGSIQSCDIGRRTARDTTMRGIVRAEYQPGDEKRGVATRPGSLASGDDATRRAAGAVARAPGGGAADLVIADYAEDAARRRDADPRRADRVARELRHSARGPSEVVLETGALAAARGGPALGLLAVRMADAARRATSDAVGASMIDGESRGAGTGDVPTGANMGAFVMAHTTGDAAKAEEIIDIARTIARALPGHEAGMVGGVRGAMIGDADDGAYMQLDAVLMSLACAARGTPQEDVIRRQIITDAHAPTASEIMVATRLAQESGAMFRGFDVRMAGARDIESGEMEVARHNKKSLARASGPRAGVSAARKLTDTQLVADIEVFAPDRGRRAQRTDAARTVTRSHIAVQRAGRADVAGPEAHAEIADRIEPPVEGLRATRAVRVGPRTASRRSIHAQEDMVEDRIRDT